MREGGQGTGGILQLVSLFTQMNLVFLMGYGFLLVSLFATILPLTLWPISSV